MTRALEARELSEAAGDRRAQAQVHNILGVLARSRRELPAAREELERSLDLAEGLGDAAARAAALGGDEASRQPETWKLVEW